MPLLKSDNNNLTLILLITTGLVLLDFLSFLLWQSYPSIANENGLLEDGQVGFLMISCVIAALRFGRMGSGQSLDKDLILALLFSSLVILVREVDIDKLGRSALWPFAEKVIRTIVAVALLMFIVSLFRKLKLLTRNFTNLLKTPMTLMVLFGALLYLCSWPLDKSLIAMETGFSQFLEEMVELDACILLAFAAVARGIKHEAFEPAKAVHN